MQKFPEKFILTSQIMNDNRKETNSIGSNLPSVFCIRPEWPQVWHGVSNKTGARNKIGDCNKIEIGKNRSWQKIYVCNKSQVSNITGVTYKNGSSNNSML